MSQLVHAVLPLPRHHDRGLIVNDKGEVGVALDRAGEALDEVGNVSRPTQVTVLAVDGDFAALYREGEGAFSLLHDAVAVLHVACTWR